MEQLKKLFLSSLILLPATIMYAQNEIKGTVLDDLGETVIGASVLEKGTTNGTITDFDGNFSLKVDAGKTLVISYVGYKTIEVPAQNGMTVTLSEDAEMIYCSEYVAISSCEPRICEYRCANNAIVIHSQFENSGKQSMSLVQE